MNEIAVKNFGEIIMIKKAVLRGIYTLIKLARENQDVIDAASKYYDDDDPRDYKKRWQHVLDAIETAEKIRGRELTRNEMGMLAFHDSAYKDYGMKNHARNGARIFRKAAPELGYSPEDIRTISRAIRYHMNHPHYKNSPLFKDDLQMLMFAADEGKPVPLKETYKRQLQKALDRKYSELNDLTLDELPEAAVKRLRRVAVPVEMFAYHDKAYPGYQKKVRDYLNSDDIINDYRDMIRNGDVRVDDSWK